MPRRVWVSLRPWSSRSRASACPPGKGWPSRLYGGAYGLFPIGWIILNVIFLYDLACGRGLFAVLQDSLTGITQDRRLQLLLIAFCFGAFFEGAAGFGTPVAVTAAILIGLGFAPLQASGLSLIANTAPVAFGALGTPIVALAGVTGLDVRALSAMVGRQLPIFSVLIPFWLVAAFAGFGPMFEIWPALLVAGVSFGVCQFLISNFHGPWLAGVLSAVVSMAALVAFLRRVASASDLGAGGARARAREARGRHGHARAEVLKAWLPWLLLSVIVFLWGIPQVKALLDGLWSVRIPVPGVDRLIFRVPPVVPRPVAEPAVFSFNGLTFTGTGIFVAALLSAAADEIPAARSGRGLVEDGQARSLFASDGGGDARPGLRLPLRGARRDIGAGLRPDRRPLSVLRDDARLAGRRPDRLGHLIERAVRQPAEDLGPAARPRSRAHGRGQQLGRGDGQDDRRPEHRRGQHRHEMVRPRRRDPALRLLPQPGPGRPDGAPRPAPGLCLLKSETRPSNYLSGGGRGREVGLRVAEDIVAEPGEVVLHDRPHGFGLRDPVAVALVDDHFHRHAAVLEPLPELVGVGDGHPPVELAVLDEGRRLGFLDVGHGRGELVDLRVVGRVGPEIVDRERGDVGVVIIRRPIGDAGADRNGLEPVG